MKKSLLAVAVVAALPAVAQAQTNVTMFGILDASVSMTDRNGTSTQPGKATQLISGVVATNRWGVRGSEDLGGGMSAVFHLEGGLNVDDGTGKATGAFDFQRRSVVGLSGGFGTVVFGRDYTPGFLHAINADQGAFGYWGTNLLNWTASPTGVTTNAANGIRWSNGIHYSGNFGPVNVRAAYSMGIGSGNGERDVAPKQAGTATGLSVQYAAGPFSVHGFFHSMNDPVAAGATQTKTKQSGVGGTFRVGPANLMIGYVATDPDGAVKQSGVSVGANIALGGGNLGLQVHNIKEDSTSQKGTQIGINYTKPMSKRTDLYVSAGVMRNKGSNGDGNASSGTFALRASDFQINPAAAGSDPKAISFGVLHRF